MPPDLSRALTISQAAARRGRSEKSARRAVYDGKLRAYRDETRCGALRILPEDVDAWAALEQLPADRQIDLYVKRVIAAAPDLTPDQRNQLAEALAVSA